MPTSWSDESCAAILFPFWHYKSLTGPVKREVQPTAAVFETTIFTAAPLQQRKLPVYL
jgi:hypothetical protein